MINKSVLFFLFLSLTACSDKLDIAKLKGSYSGTFIYQDKASSVAPASTGLVTVTFTENAYLSTGNENYIPAGGSGVFELTEDNTIKFTDQNGWFANFDWNLILSGSYKYKLKGDSLILKKQANPRIKNYEYRLKRTE